MQISIAPSVLNDDRWHPVLDVIAYAVTAAESRLAFEAANIRSLLSSPWLVAADGYRGSLPDLIQASLRAFNRGTPSDAVTVVVDATAPMSGETAGSTIRIHPLGCISLISRPFKLIVEDENTDGGFILWMARLLGREEVIRAYVGGRLAFRHAGGKGQVVKSASALTQGIWPRAGRVISAMELRCAVVLDSDAKFPGHSPNQSICDDVAPWVAFSHILAGRTIENYVPEKYFKRRLEADGIRGVAEAFFFLTDDQRAYFPVKRGFQSGDKPPKVQSHAEFCADVSRMPEEKIHFQAIDQINWAKLANGFGERLASVVTLTEYRCEPGDCAGLTSVQRTELSNLITKLLRFL